jgi:hypothetical protein
MLKNAKNERVCSYYPPIVLALSVFLTILNQFLECRAVLSYLNLPVALGYVSLQDIYT